MRSESASIVGPDRATAGPASLVQGVYGARGNLELVVPDAVDGLWVFWFNADLPTDPPASAEVPSGAWSAGLAFAAGERYLTVEILQSALGPDHLEVLALAADGVLQSWFWSPGPGFQRRTADAASGVVRVAAEHEGGRIAVTVADGEGRIRHLVSDPEPYPDRTWRPTPTGPALQDDAEATRLLAAAGVQDAAPGTARVARSTRDGGTRELTWRDASGTLHHRGIPAPTPAG